MPPRDEQDYEERRQQIIDGALSVFGSKGFEKATNKDIANAAKIGSPAFIAAIAFVAAALACSLAPAPNAVLWTISLS